MTLRSVAFSFIFFLLVVPAHSRAESKRITDELVQNLQCDTLSADSIYRAINPDSFNESRTYPIRNFQTDRMAGHCWAIARFDRIALFLGRMDARLAPSSSEKIADMARVRNETRIPYTPLKITNWMRNPLEVFKWPVIHSAVDRAQRSVDPKSVPQIREALEAAQGHLFYRSKNIPFVLRSEYSVADKRKELALAIKLANAKKLPLINIRYNRLMQHIVVVKWIQRLSPGEFYIYTIDSNSSTAMIRVKTTDTSFSAVDEGGREPTDIEMFTVVEEEDRPQIEMALLSYYRNLCR